MKCPACNSELEIELVDKTPHWKRIVRGNFVRYFWVEKLGKRNLINYGHIEETDLSYINARVYKFRIKVEDSPMGDTYARGIIILRRPFNIKIYRGDPEELLQDRPWEEGEFYAERD